MPGGGTGGRQQWHSDAGEVGDHIEEGRGGEDEDLTLDLEHDTCEGG